MSKRKKHIGLIITSSIIFIGVGAFLTYSAIGSLRELKNLKS